MRSEPRCYDNETHDTLGTSTNRPCVLAPILRKPGWNFLTRPHVRLRRYERRSIDAICIVGKVYIYSSIRTLSPVDP